MVVRKSFLRVLIPIVLLAACDSAPDRAVPVGVAWVGAPELKLRQEIAPRSGTVATVHHLDRLEIIRNRRTFYLVRTQSGVEGWTHERMLLNADEVERLRDLASQSKSMPSQGIASVFDLLNVHTEPHRQAPSFHQMKEHDKVEVLAHRVVPRDDEFRRSPLIAPPQKATKKQKEKPKEPAIPLPEAPAAPDLPPEWLQLSNFDPSVVAPPPPPEPARPVRLDDWTLIRYPSGTTGWVLTSQLYMAIPDEVAQYAEGRRIMAYFDMGEVKDGEITKKTWLWATTDQRYLPYDFDNLRLFVWSTRRHRYETGFSERGLKGRYPIRVHRSGNGRADGFTIEVERGDGARYLRSYSYDGNRIRMAGERPVQGLTPPKSEPAPVPAPESETTNRSVYRTVKDKVDIWRRRVFGR